MECSFYLLDALFYESISLTDCILIIRTKSEFLWCGFCCCWYQVPELFKYLIICARVNSCGKYLTRFVTVALCRGFLSVSSRSKLQVLLVRLFIISKQWDCWELKNKKYLFIKDKFQFSFLRYWIKKIGTFLNNYEKVPHYLP